MVDPLVIVGVAGAALVAVSLAFNKTRKSTNSRRSSRRSSRSSRRSSRSTSSSLSDGSQGRRSSNGSVSL